jgi:hypothetical protein
MLLPFSFTVTIRSGVVFGVPGGAFGAGSPGTGDWPEAPGDAIGICGV